MTASDKHEAIKHVGTDGIALVLQSWERDCQNEVTKESGSSFGNFKF